jgi:hypothetical protein
MSGGAQAATGGGARCGKQVLVSKEKSCRLPVAPVCRGSRRASIYQDTHPGLISMSSFGWEGRYIDVAVADPGCSTYLAAGSVSGRMLQQRPEKDKQAVQL